MLDDEEANVRETIPLVEADSSLGWEPSMFYVADREHLEWKLRQLGDARMAVSSRSPAASSSKRRQSESDAASAASATKPANPVAR